MLAVCLHGAGVRKSPCGRLRNLASVSSGSMQIPRNIAVALLFSQVHWQAAPGVTHIQPRPCLVQHHQRVQEALPSGIVHRSGESGGVGAVGFRSVEQQQLCHLGAAHHHDLGGGEEESAQGESG